MRAIKKIFKGLMVLWALWLAFGVSWHHRELLTYAGSDYWSQPRMQERARTACLRIPASNPADCEAIRVDYVTEDLVDIMMWVFEKMYIQAPAVAISLFMTLMIFIVGLKRLLFRRRGT